MESDDCLQVLILEKIKPDLTATLAKLYNDQPQPKHTDRDLLQLTFKNYRYKNNKHHGLRLTYQGVTLLKKHYESYTYAVEEKPTHQAFVRLDKNMKWPYYISKRNATFFNENDAAWYRLNGGNLTSFTEYI